jgi:pimeloyl-ACP methyl ester carboxylesterase
MVPIFGIYAGPSGIASAQAVHDSFPTTEYTQIPSTGHFLMLEKPEEFNRLLLGFLSKQKY